MTFTFCAHWGIGMGIRVRCSPYSCRPSENQIRDLYDTEPHLSQPELEFKQSRTPNWLLALLNPGITEIFGEVYNQTVIAMYIQLHNIQNLTYTINTRIYLIFMKCPLDLCAETGLFLMCILCIMGLFYTIL